MYQNKYPKMVISIGIYSINRPQGGTGGGFAYIYICIHMFICVICVRSHIYVCFVLFCSLYSMYV